MNYPMRNNPMFPNQPPVAPNPQRAIMPNPSGIATLQQYVNPRPMPQTGTTTAKPTMSAFDKLKVPILGLVDNMSFFQGEDGKKSIVKGKQRG